MDKPIEITLINGQIEKKKRFWPETFIEYLTATAFLSPIVGLLSVLPYSIHISYFPKIDLASGTSLFFFLITTGLIIIFFTVGCIFLPGFYYTLALPKKTPEPEDKTTSQSLKLRHFLNCFSVFFLCSAIPMTGLFLFNIAGWIIAIILVIGLFLLGHFNSLEISKISPWPWPSENLSPNSQEGVPALIMLSLFSPVLLIFIVYVLVIFFHAKANSCVAIISFAIVLLSSAINALFSLQENARQRAIFSFTVGTLVCFFSSVLLSGVILKIWGLGCISNSRLILKEEFLPSIRASQIDGMYMSRASSQFAITNVSILMAIGNEIVIAPRFDKHPNTALEMPPAPHPRPTNILIIPKDMVISWQIINGDRPDTGEDFLDTKKGDIK